MFHDALKRLLHWALLALILHGLWEAAQLPLYTLWADSSCRRILSYLFHCIAGDVLIAMGAYLITATIFRNIDWPWRDVWRGGAVMIVLGLVYTVFSEWYNVYQLRAWSYAASMPLVMGIGLVPLMQWLVVPILMIVIFRRRR
ncbi:MAG: hypothetical protein HZA59_08405 [Hydrogenophilales bacterium]|nr:hypothetical protein [Hydrogenophilales bacterium]